MIRPLGKHSPVVRRVRTLRRDAALRRDEGVLIAEGLHLAAEALASGVEVELALVSPELTKSAEGRDLLERLSGERIEIGEVADSVLETVADTRSPQPVLLVVRRPQFAFEQLLGEGAAGPMIAVACGLQDPGNLGSVIRSADAAGASGCAICGDGVDPFHPRVVRGSMGSILRLPVVELEPSALLPALVDREIRTLGTSAEGGEIYTDTDLTGSFALFLGHEGAGLSATLTGQLDRTLRIPMRDGVESLSVGAAAAAILFEAARQRRPTDY